MATNAVYELITRDAPLPTARAVYRAGVIAGLIFTAYLIWETLVRWPEHSTVGGAMYPGALVSIILIPPIVSTIAGIVTAHHARRIDFTLLRATPLTPLQIAWGFLRGAFYHNRVVLAIGLSILPVLSIGLMQFQVDAAYHVFTTCGLTCSGPPWIIDTTFFWPNYDDFMERAIAELVMVSAMGASAIPAASVGVRIGLASGNRFLAGMAAFSSAVIYPLAVTYLMNIFENVSLPLALFALVYLLGFSAIGAVMFQRTVVYSEGLRSNAPPGLSS